jgi:protein phosphatase
MPGVEGEILKFRLTDGDRLLLCTDGLTEMVRDDRIADMLGQSPNAEDACRGIIEAALTAGGRDNITVVIASCSLEKASQTPARS